MKPRASMTVSSYAVNFMGLNGIKNFEPTDSSKQWEVVHSQTAL